MHDTIPFRYPPSRALAPLMRAYIALDGAPLDARGDRLRVLEAEPAGRPRARPRPHRGAHARDRPRGRGARACAARGDVPRGRAGDVRRARRAPQEPRPARARLRARATSRAQRRGAHARGGRRRRGRPAAVARRRAPARGSSCPGVVSQADARAAARVGDDARAAVAGGGLRPPGRRGAGRGHPRRDQHRARAARDHPRRRRSRRSIPLDVDAIAHAIDQVAACARPGARSSTGRARSTSRARCSRPWTAPKPSGPESNVDTC